MSSPPVGDEDVGDPADGVAGRIRFLARRVSVGLASRIPLGLLRCDSFEDRVEMLVFDDDARHELRLVRVKQAIGEDAIIAPADRDAAIGVLAHEREGPAEPAIVHGILEHVEPALVVDGELGADPTRFLEGEDPGELLRWAQRAVGIVRRAGWLREAHVVIGR